MGTSRFLLLLCLVLHNLHHSHSFSLSVEDVIVSSPKGTFTAGFHPVGDNAFCFATWYTRPPRTVVWMANRDQPVNGKSSELSLLKTGNLVLTDAGQFIAWSTNTATTSKQLRLRLYDTGNLVLLETSDDNVLWQSFDFPTDTLLPNQLLKGSTSLISSRSGTNHSSGYYKLFFDFENVLRLMFQGPRVSSVYWPYAWLQNNNFGNGNGRSTFNDTRVVMLDDFGKMVSSDNFTFTTIDYGTVLRRRLTLDHDGNARVYSIRDGEDQWQVTGIFRPQPCFIHGICGPNSYCFNRPTSGRTCSCLPGYRWVDSQDWSQGCESNFQLWCNNTEKESHFLRLSEFDFYGYDYGYYPNHTIEQCVNLCSGLCECKGFQHSFSGGSDSGSQCYLKRQLLNGHHSPGFSGSFFLRLPLSLHDYDEKAIINNENGLVCQKNSGEVKVLERPYVEEKENESVKFMLWFASALGGIELLCFFLVWCFLFRNNADKQAYVLAAETGFQKFSYSEMKQATKGFSEEIGRGAGGTVYKGVLYDNRDVAIKRLHEFVNQGENEFLAELSIIGRLNHMNLIGMFGYCAEGKYRLLVYEYMENGSLAENLSSCSNVLDWSKRYNIALGTARGLAYLHEECLEWVLHCDIKPQNILLDSDYQPKVADFGLSKLLNRNSLNNSSFSTIRGTRGYLAPEWVFNLPITSKVDVYSYGIVVLEMITGKSPTAGIQITELEAESHHHERLVTWVREKRKKGSEVGSSWVDQIVDPALGSNYDRNKMEILTTVALECVEEDKDVRPSMSTVVERLQNHEHNS